MKLRSWGAIYLLVIVCFTTVDLHAIDTAQSGNWNDTNTWVGGVVPGGGDNATLLYDVVVPDGYTNAAVNSLYMNVVGAEVTVLGTGHLDVNGTIEFRADWASDNTHFTFSDNTRFRSWGSPTWTHNGDLAFSNRYYDQDTGGNVTFSGTGLLTLAHAKLWRNNATLTIDRNFTTGAIYEDSNTTENYKVNFKSGTTTTDYLLPLGDFGGALSTVNFSGVTAVLLVNTNSLDLAAATAAITNGYITLTNTVVGVNEKGGLAVEVVDILGTDYTKITKWYPPSATVVIIR